MRHGVFIILLRISAAAVFVQVHRELSVGPVHDLAAACVGRSGKNYRTRILLLCNCADKINSKLHYQLLIALADVGG